MNRQAGLARPASSQIPPQPHTSHSPVGKLQALILLGSSGLVPAYCLQRSSALVSPAPARLPRADWPRMPDPPRENAKAESRIGGLAVPGRGRALRPPLRPHYGGAHAAHRVVGARRGPPRLPPPPAPSPASSRPRQARRRLPAASLTAAVRAGPARVGARQPPQLTVTAPPFPSPAARAQLPGLGRVRSSLTLLLGKEGLGHGLVLFG